MTTVGNLSIRKFTRRLADEGVELVVGPFIVQLKSGIRSLAHSLHLLYRDYAVASPNSLIDFSVSIDRSGCFRRWVRPQSKFILDGHMPFNPMPLQLALPLYEWGFNYCVASRAHQYLVVHAGVVARNGEAAILPGPPGAGKSTLTAALCHSGWRLCSDELALFRPEDCRIVPVPRPIALKNNSIDIIRRFAPDAVFGPLCRETAKGTIAHMQPPAHSVQCAGRLVRPRWLIVPRYIPGARGTCEPVSRAQGLLTLAQNGFNYSVLGEVGFQTLAAAVQHMECCELRYSNLQQALEIFAGLRAGESTDSSSTPLADLPGELSS